MLHCAVVFLLIALVAGVLGFSGIAGTAAGIAKILFPVFLTLLQLSCVIGTRGRSGVWRQRPRVHGSIWPQHPYSFHNQPPSGPLEKHMAATTFQKNTWRKALLIAGFAAGLGGVVASTCADTDSPTPHSDGVGAAITDTAITAKVKVALTGDQLKNSDVSVTTTNGVVTLTGSAGSPDAKSYAEAQTRSVDGVKSVDDELTTPSSGATSARIHHAEAKTRRVVSDSWITTKVKSEILADSVSKGFDVSVTTKHGVVMLKGSLANGDAVAHVKDIASQVKGVKSVDTSMLKSTT